MEKNNLVRLNPIEFNQILKELRESVLKYGDLEGRISVEAVRFTIKLHYYCQVYESGEIPFRTYEIYGICIDEIQVYSHRFDGINHDDWYALEERANDMLKGKILR